VRAALHRGHRPPRRQAQIEGYHLYVGGGFADQQALGRELLRDVPAAEVPQVIERLLRGYMEGRAAADEPFHEFARRHSPAALRALATPVEAA